MSAQQRCPICEGHGILPHGFYLVPAGQPFASTSTSPDRCRNCLGSGIVWTTATESFPEPLAAEAKEVSADAGG